jgi:hypothetical protein
MLQICNAREKKNHEKAKWRRCAGDAMGHDRRGGGEGTDERREKHVLQKI